MLKFNFTQSISLLLALLLFAAPFEALFASSHVGHGAEPVEMGVQMSDMSAHDYHLANADVSNDHAGNTSDDCEKQCVHCVFCSAVIFSAERANNQLLSVYRSYINKHAPRVLADLHIQPPISIS